MKNRSNRNRFCAFLSLLLCVCLLCAGCGKKEKSPVEQLSARDPQVLTLWHYYNGAQQQVFDELVLAFNESVGKELGIVVEARSQSSVSYLVDKLMASARNDYGADEMPDIFAAYADVAQAVNALRPLADLSPYLTEEERHAYLDAYMREGELNEPGTLRLFPIAKSTELLMINETEWQRFAGATGADEGQLATWEGIVDLSRQYYEWTDGLTPEVEHDGKAFFGRDAFANYMLIGSLQLGSEMFAVENKQLHLQVDEGVMRRLWDNYMVPYVNGWFGSYGAFRSDDVKTGKLVALVGSTSGGLYFPSAVTRDDGTTFPIEGRCFPLPNFAGTAPYAVQQGAGMAVVASTPVQEYAATVFLKWMTENENNIQFSLKSGYLPVKKEANTAEVLEKEMDKRQVTGLLRSIILHGAQITTNYSLYTNSPFTHGTEARAIVDTHMPQAAAAAIARRDELVASGVKWDEAVRQLTGDEAFQTWLTSFRAALAEAVKDPMVTEANTEVLPKE